MNKSFMEENEGGVSLHVYVVPNSDANRIAEYNRWRNALKIPCDCASTNDCANSCLVTFLAEFFVWLKKHTDSFWPSFSVLSRDLVNACG